MPSGFVTLLDRYVPDDPARDGKRRARLTAGVLLTTAVTAPVIGAPYALAGAWVVTSVSLGAGALAACMLPVLRSGRHALSSQAAIGLLYLLLLGLSAMSGGLHAPALPWLAILPMLALGLSGRNAAVVWTMFVVAAVSFFYVLQASGAPLPGALGSGALPVVHFSSLMGLAVFVLAVGTLFEATRSQAAREAAASHRQLAGARDVLQKALVATRAAATAKNQFLANVSHEIRTPLNGVVGMTGLLLETPLNEEQREYAEAARQCGDSLLSVVGDMLDFAQLESGKLEIGKQDIQLRELVTDVLHVADASARKSGLALACEVAPEVPERLRGDPSRLRQVLNNLLHNAVKFTERGEVQLSITLEPVSGPAPGRAPALRFEVKDTGIGLTTEQQQRLFRPFAQADDSNARKYGGTGLGLVIAKELVELMGGRLGVQSEYGHGSTFWFTMRLEQQAAQRDRAEDLAHVRVLVVDPDATSRRIVQAHLDGVGLRVDEAVDALEGLDALRAAYHGGRPYDVVFVEVQMPHMDGLELAAEIRGDPALARLPIVALTSTGDASNRERAQRAGIQSYLTKPAEGAQLIDAVASLLLPDGAPAHPPAAPEHDDRADAPSRSPSPAQAPRSPVPVTGAAGPPAGRA
ncbi:MAG: ATP-binding protein [Planctomycetota bacterium]|jgi:signal transduction histidine kinase/CheY-like chemotaxis protein